MVLLRQPQRSDHEASLFENLAQEEILTLPELATRLRVSIPGLRKILARQPLTGAFKVGQQWRFRWPLVVQALSTKKETAAWHD